MTKTIKVHLRSKKLKDPVQKSLYLDFWPPIVDESGKTSRREFLGLYVFSKPKNPIEKSHNAEATHLAEAIRSKRHKQLNQTAALTELEKREVRKDEILNELAKGDFLDYFKRLGYKRKGSTSDNWQSVYQIRMENYPMISMHGLTLSKPRRHTGNT